MGRRLRLVDGSETGEPRTKDGRRKGENYAGAQIMSHRVKMLGFELVRELQRQGHDPMLRLLDNLLFWRELVDAATAEYRLLDDFEKDSEKGRDLLAKVRDYRESMENTSAILMPFFHSRLANLSVDASNKTKNDQPETFILHFEPGDELV
jgi:hypothetical protein